MHPSAVRAIAERLAGYAFDDLYGFAWHRNIIGSARQAVDASIARYLDAVAA
jgi:hypothetical protein